MDIAEKIARLKNTTAGRVGLHAALWITYFFAFVYLSNISFGGYSGGFAVAEASKSTFTTLLIYYPLVYFARPRYWLKKKYWTALLCGILLVVIYAVADNFLEQAILRSCESCMERLRKNQNGVYALMQRGLFQVVLLQLVTLGILYQLFAYLAFPLVIKALYEYYNQQLKTLRLQKENTLLEFNFLKAQVNPHFLFNTLNNIYALILKDEKDASAETVAKLSDFMRYTLYESNNNQNNVVKEIGLLQSYIDLEKIRLNDTVVNFISDTDRNEYTLPPLLFLPAVENAFKYCSRNAGGDAYIFIRLQIQEAHLVFAISNTFDRLQDCNRLQGGIGLQNLQKRLEHYYPGGLSMMKITTDENVFEMIVHITLA